MRIDTTRIAGLVIVVAMALGTLGCATESEQQRGDRADQYDSGWLAVSESPTRGPDNAILTVVVFNDLLCGPCDTVHDRVSDMRKKRDDLRVVHKFYPVDDLPNRLAARAGAYAHEQGEFWAFYEAIRSRREAVKKNPRTELASIGEEIGLDPGGLASALEGRVERPKQWPDRIREDIEMGRKLGLGTAPSLFVNGHQVRAGSGSLSRIVALARKEATLLMKGDVDPGRLYQTASGLAYNWQNLGERSPHSGPITASRVAPGTGKAVDVGEGDRGEDSPSIPIGDSPVLGPADALVTIVEFSDFQCPFCRKGYERVKKLRKQYPDRVRVVFKHYPLPFHDNAKPAARIAMAAGEQGEKYFWKMHDKLFEHQGEWKNGRVTDVAMKWAKEMDGLDAGRLKNDLRTNKEAYNKRINGEMQKGKELGVKGTPHYFINGVKLSGAQPYGRFKSIVDTRIKQAKSLLKEGYIDKSNLYKAAVAKNFEAPSPSPKKKKPSPKKKKGPKVEYVPVDEDDAVAGASADEALVTFVVFSDFQCPFCDKVKPSVNKLKKNYGDEVRFVFKHRPLPMHRNAKPAARASIAAQKQGKFWEMHDLLFENQNKVKNNGKEALVGLAKELDLDVQKFKKDMASQDAKKAVRSDIKLAEKIGAGGTPNFWINGVNVVGAQPYSKFKTVIDKQIERAKTLKKEKGVSGKKLYKAVVELNDEKVGEGGDGASADRGDGGDDKPTRVDRSKLEVGDAPTMGPKDAPVTIFMFSDFECPFCARAHGTVEKIMENFEGEVRLVYKHFPLPMHKNAVEAAKASVAAQKQGKFWEMYDVMYNNQKKLGRDGVFERWAAEVGLNVSKFKKDMKNVPDERIEKDEQMGRSVGVRGTPGFFINGLKLIGAQPYNKFKSVIEDELERVEGK